MTQILSIATPMAKTSNRTSPRPVRIVQPSAETPRERRIFSRQREYATQKEFVAQLQQHDLLRSFRLNPWV
jgi:hypothetical protein